MNKPVIPGLGNKEVFSRNLQRYVAMSGDKQTVIAKAVGVSAGTFSDWMKGRAHPRMDKVQLLADYFGIKKSDLVEDGNIVKDAVSNQEQIILDLFHKVPDDKKELVIKMIQAALDNQ